MIKIYVQMNANPYLKQCRSLTMGHMSYYVLCSHGIEGYASVNFSQSVLNDTEKVPNKMLNKTGRIQICNIMLIL